MASVQDSNAQYNVQRNGPGALMVLVKEEHPSLLVRLAAKFDYSIGLSDSRYTKARQSTFAGETIDDNASLFTPAPPSRLVQAAVGVWKFLGGDHRESERQQKESLRGEAPDGSAAEARLIQGDKLASPRGRAVALLDSLIAGDNPVKLLAPEPSSYQPAAAQPGETRPSRASSMLNALQVETPRWAAVRPAPTFEGAPPPMSVELRERAKNTKENFEYAGMDVGNGVSERVFRTKPGEFNLTELRTIQKELGSGAPSFIRQSESTGHWYLGMTASNQAANSVDSTPIYVISALNAGAPENKGNHHVRIMSTPKVRSGN